MAEMPRKFTFMWCYFFLEILALDCTYLWEKMGHQISHYQSHLQKNGIYVQKIAFLDIFERIFEKFQAIAKLRPEF